MRNAVPFGILHVGLSFALAAILLVLYRRVSRVVFLLYWALFWIDIGLSIGTSQVIIPLVGQVPGGGAFVKPLMSFAVFLLPTFPSLMICAALSVGRERDGRRLKFLFSVSVATGLVLGIVHFLTAVPPAYGSTLGKYRPIATALTVFFFVYRLARDGDRNAIRGTLTLTAVSFLYGVHNLLLSLGVYGSTTYSVSAATVGILFQLALTIILCWHAVDRAAGIARKLREHEQTLRVIFNAHQDLQSLIRVETDGRFVNEAFNRAQIENAEQFMPDPLFFIGRGRDEFLRAMGIPEPEVLRAVAQWQQAAASGKPLYTELTYTAGPDKRRETGEFALVPILNEAGVCTHLLWTGHFITERKRAGEELAKRERELSEAQSIGHIGSWSWDVASGHVACSDEMYRILGYEPGSVAPSFAWLQNIVAADDRERVRTAFEEAFAARSGLDLVYRIVRPDGSVRVVEGSSVIQKDASGIPVRRVGTLHDITEQSRLAEREISWLRHLKQLSELSMMLAGDPATVFERVVRMIGELFELPLVCVSEVAGRELVFRTLYDSGKVISNPGGCSLDVSPCAAVEASGRMVVCEDVQEQYPRSDFLREHNAWFYCGFPALDANGAVVATLCLMDRKAREFDEEDQQILQVIGQRIAAEIVREKALAERARMEEELRDSKLRLEQAQQMAHLGSYSADPVTGAMEWSDELYRICERDRGAGPVSMALVLSMTHPDDRARLTANRAVVRRTGRFAVEHRIVMADARIKYVQTQGEIGNGPDGKPVIRGTVQDITERKLAEQEKARLEAQLNQAHKMESVGRLAGGIAHDFNNLLTVINGYSGILMDRLDVQGRQYASQIQKAGESAASLTRQLLAFSRMEVKRPEPVRLNRVVAESREMLQRMVGAHIEMETRILAFPDNVLAEPHQIQQCLMNLVVNARDAMPSGGRIVIETNNALIADDDVPRDSDSAPGRHVCLSVRDTGTGIDEETGRRIFEPFFTTKEKGRGTGLGLSTVYGIVQQWRGFLKVVSTPGQGSHFTIFLPLDTSAPRLAAGAAAELHRQLPVSETVLVVEDEDMVRMYVTESLERSGYRVLQASGGTAALRMVEDADLQIDLMLTDYMMPGMRGNELADRARVVRPELKVLLMTGHQDGSLKARAGLDEVMLKPFAPDVLAARVRDVLGARVTA